VTKSHSCLVSNKFCSRIKGMSVLIRPFCSRDVVVSIADVEKTLGEGVSSSCVPCFDHQMVGLD